MSEIGASSSTSIADLNHMDAPSSPVDPALLAWAEYWYPIAWKGLIIAGLATALGAVATIAFLLLQWRTTSIREDQSEWRTASLELRAAQLVNDSEQLRKGTAEANARAAEADERTERVRAAFERQIKPRQFQLKPAEFKEKLSGKPVARMEYRYDPAVSDSYPLALGISSLLLEAGWLPVPVFDRVKSDPLRSGIEIRGGSGTEKSVEALVNALLACEMSDGVSFGQNEQYGSYDVVAPNMVRVTVWGRAPSWVAAPTGEQQRNTATKP